MKKNGRAGMKLGITGGIGSGKTSVCSVFNVLGIPVFSADEEAGKIMENDSVIAESINSIVGRDIYSAGTLNRMELASIIFNDSNLLNKINELVHPVVFESFLKWEKEQISQYVIMEAAILIESGACKLVDKIVAVIAPVEERIARIISRNNLTMVQVQDRLKNQLDDESRIRHSDYVIHNSENDLIIPSILQIHNDILSFTKIRA